MACGISLVFLTQHKQTKNPGRAPSPCLPGTDVAPLETQLLMRRPLRPVDEAERSAKRSHVVAGNKVTLPLRLLESLVDKVGHR
jgi:hypothetical protein